MAPCTKEIEFAGDIDTVFEFICDPRSWQLHQPSLEGLSQHPASAGTTWTFAGSKFVCVELIAPRRFSFEADGVTVTYLFSSGGASSTKCRLDVPRSPSESTSKTGDKQWDLIVGLKKVFEDTVGTRDVGRVTMNYRRSKVNGLPSLSVCTEALIRRPTADVFRIVVGDPSEFWKWMVDRCNPGGLFVADKRPSEGSYYKYKKRTQTRQLHPFNPWDEGIVSVISLQLRKSAVLEEHQKSVNSLITTTYTFEEADSSLQEMTLLKSEYLFQIKHWLWRRTIASAALSLLPQEMLKQTANIIRVCERPSTEANGER